MTPHEQAVAASYKLGLETMRQLVLQELAKWKDEHDVARNIEHYIKKIQPEAT